jgi:hypothetical protein
MENLTDKQKKEFIKLTTANVELENLQLYLQDNFYNKNFCIQGTDKDHWCKYLSSSILIRLIEMLKKAELIYNPIKETLVSGLDIDNIDILDKVNKMNMTAKEFGTSLEEFNKSFKKRK